MAKNKKKIKQKKQKKDFNDTLPNKSEWQGINQNRRNKRKKHR